MQRIAHIALVVRDYEEALDFYVGKLRFVCLEDTPQRQENKRWVVVAPPGGAGPSLILSRARNEEQAKAIGKQGGGRVFLFLATDDFDRDYASYRDSGVRFVREPKVETYGTVAVFEDLYGNLWDLVAFAPGHPAA